MDWQKCMNQAIDYIESNLSNDIDYSIAAQFVSCSVWEFQRVFSFMAQFPLSEYIRRRRLTLAAMDIQSGRGRIIDIALRYGYESQAAFSRAFSQLHGVPPSSARDDGILLKAFPRLTFKFILQGVEPMDYRIEKKEAFDIIGFTRCTTEENELGTIGQMWSDFFSQNWWDTLGKYHKYPNGNDPNGVNPDAIYSYSFSSYNGNDNTGNVRYYTIGVLYNDKDYSKDRNKYNDELKIIHIPSCSYAVFVKNNNDGDFGDFAGRIYREWLPSSGYQLTGGPEIELTSSKTDGIYWLPIKQ